MRQVGGIAAFVGGYALFDALPVLLAGKHVLHGLRWGDLIDAPLLFLLVALYVGLGLQAGLWRSTALKVANAAVLVLLVQGHGIHLAANAIGANSSPSSPSWETSYFLDEHWGHVELHLGIILMALLFVVAALPMPGGEGRAPTVAERWLLRGAALVFGLFLTADGLEGQTAPLMMAAGVLLPGVALALRNSAASPHRLFFASAFAVALIALGAYRLVYGGFPELKFI